MSMADHGFRQCYPARDARVGHREGSLSAERPVVGPAIAGWSRGVAEPSHLVLLCNTQTRL